MVSKNKKKVGWFSKAGKWIESNINPDIYSSGLDDMGFDVDPWNPFGKKRKSSRKKTKKKKRR